MPAGVDEATWNRAKAQAEKQGKGENWPYVMSIYKKMSGEKTAGLKKVADIEDVGQWYWHPDLEAMRKGLWQTGEFDTARYRKKTVEELDKAISEIRAERAEEAARAAAGDIETPKEHRGAVIADSLIGGIVGGMSGAGLALPAQLLKLNPKFKGKPIGTALTMGGLGLGAIIGGGGRLLQGRRPIEPPEPEEQTYIPDLMKLRRDFGKPYSPGKPHPLPVWLGERNIERVKAGAFQSSEGNGEMEKDRPLPLIEGIREMAKQAFNEQQIQAEIDRRNRMSRPARRPRGVGAAVAQGAAGVGRSIGREVTG